MTLNWGSYFFFFCALVAHLSSQKWLTSLVSHLFLALAGGLCLGCGLGTVARKGFAEVPCDSRLLIAWQPEVSSESHGLVYALILTS